ncbi:hypothetical protein [Caballeronia mineralivorans]|jgi:hypothetical protein|uniref:hypothetical protein n=1 Tax=Caballeronia mineralivorans TaxID=2010198 RepID=UPI0023F15AE7|nr:hypothetical protein [Caballeronia mineralivorans]MDB5780858.1 hypothetical protein [Caballeronia mineralivorans]
MLNLLSLLHAGASKDELTQVPPKVLRIASELQGLDYAGLLLVQGLVEQMAQTTLRRFAHSHANAGELSPEVEALLAPLVGNTDAADGRELAKPREKRAFSVRERHGELAAEPAIVAASARGHADLNAILNSAEFVTLSQAAQACGTSEQTIRVRVRERRLFSVTGPGGTRSKYPVWQFSPAWGQGVLEALLRAMPQKSGLEVYRFFTTPNPHLVQPDSTATRDPGPTPLDLLGIARDGSGRAAPRPLTDTAVQTVLALAQAFAAEGATAA